MAGFWSLLALLRSAGGWRASVDNARQTVAQLRSSAGQVQTALFQRTRTRALQGDARAQYEMGEYFYEGRGVPRDLVEAAGWFTQAAEQGLAQAQCSLGLMSFLGRGLPRDPVQGYKWLLLASRQKNERAIQACPRALTKLAPAEKLAAEELAAEFRPAPSGGGRP